MASLGELVRRTFRRESEQQVVSRGLMLGMATSLREEGTKDVRVYEGDGHWVLRFGAIYNLYPPTLPRTQWTSYGLALRTFDDGSSPWVKYAVDNNGWQDVETHDENRRRLSTGERLQLARQRATLQPDDRYQKNLYPIRRPPEYSFERQIF